MANQAYGLSCSTSSTITAGEQVLHLGCGTGYYTAIMAELIGPTGKITAIEIDPGLAEKARAALVPWPQITVRNADGAGISFEPADLVIASAGATHPLPSWLDALKPGGRLLFPMTATNGPAGCLGDPRGRRCICGALSLPCRVH